jgi:hypothetical protein
MFSRLLTALLLFVGLVIACSLRAADEPKKAEPEKPDPAPAKEKAAKASDDLPGPFQCYNITGKAVDRVNKEVRKFKKEDDKNREPDKGTFHCLVSEHGLNPVVMVLVQGTEPSEALLTLLKKLDTAVEKNQNARLASFVVFLTDKITNLAEMDDQRDEVVAALEAKTKAAELKNVAVALDVLPKIKELYKLQDQAEVTVLIYNKLKVLSTHAFRKDELNDEGVQKIIAALGAHLAAIRAEGAGKSLPAR